MQVAGDILLGECHLAVSERSQGKSRILEDLLPVFARDFLLLCDPIDDALGQLAAYLALATDADLAPRLQIQSLLFQRTVIDAHCKAGTRQVFVGHLLPPLSPSHQMLALIPGALLQPKAFLSDR